MSVEFAKVVSRRMRRRREREGAYSPIDNSVKRFDDGGLKTNMAEEMSGSQDAVFGGILAINWTMQHRKTSDPPLRSLVQ